ncbi:DUF3718 domain-containing protein [Ferrimonas balearica]|uniref:DUF3718 domain-containing protein n=1 Tax=Ferrimonas balearica TaxID=44012 RepID=UPI001C997FC8|nr:DUF3718 domain-containing protein [Ferrimonas balearica]MBY5922587.1 DUF3718 domain-containing protein [Ferrimonas balearica]MBY5995571.1 DUF3718 domain-containing protein [Ferrimonas balearica]
MKALVLTTLLTAALGGVQAAEVQFVPLDNTPATKLCIAAATMHPMQLHQAIKYQGLTEQGVVRAIECNDQNIAAFAARYNPDKRSVRRLSIYAPQGTVTIQEVSVESQRSETPMVVALSGRYH